MALLLRLAKVDIVRPDMTVEPDFAPELVRQVEDPLVLDEVVSGVDRVSTGEGFGVEISDDQNDLGILGPELPGKAFELRDVRVVDMLFVSQSRYFRRYGLT